MERPEEGPGGRKAAKKEVRGRRGRVTSSQWQLTSSREEVCQGQNCGWFLENDSCLCLQSGSDLSKTATCRRPEVMLMQERVVVGGNSPGCLHPVYTP